MIGTGKGNQESLHILDRGCTTCSRVFKATFRQTSCKKERSGNGPSLGCAVQEENDHSKGEKWEFILCSQFSLVIFVLQTEAKGKKRQRTINTFIWKGNAQKKHVISKGAAELPQNRGGLAVPNLLNFWNSLKLAWLTRLIQSDESTTWKKLAMSKLASALKLENLTTTRLLSESPHSIAAAASALSNPFWKDLLKLLPSVESNFYKQHPRVLGELPVWNRKDITSAKATAFDRKSPFDRSSSKLVRRFSTISSFLSENTNTLMTEEEATGFVGKENIGTWNEIVQSITTLLLKHNLSWYAVNHHDFGPNHVGWSRVVTESYKARKYYPLLAIKNHSKGRNSNELDWTLRGLDNYSVNRWDCLYKNQKKLRCNLRVKYEEFRILWGRQELNRYKAKYSALKGGNSVACSYCQGDIETEQHLYNDCLATDEFWQHAKAWFTSNFRVAPTLALRGYRLFGMEKEPPNDLLNIFYRCARYCIFSSRRKAVLPSLKLFVSLVRDELKLKYAGTRFQKYAGCPLEEHAHFWMRKEMGWTQTIPERLPT